MLGSSKAVNAACLAVFDPSTNSALSRQLGSAKKKTRFGVFGPARLTCCGIVIYENIKIPGLFESNCSEDYKVL